MNKVTLVSGGPGDTALITMKGLKCIQEADCILYDQLINMDLLQNAKQNCELIYVGKQAGKHALQQHDINALLVEKAQIFAHVVRLKGGDLYVFGRGGEEALYLSEHHVPFDIVPGVSSCIAGLAYAGIPVTHRGVSNAFHVITAHDKDDALADIDFHTMLKDDHTYIFLMGLSMLDEIVNGFLDAGKSTTTPIAVVAHATTPEQRTVVSDLAHMIEDFKKDPLTSPALIVVGGVVNLRKQLNVYETKPLFHANVLVPKVGQSSSALSYDLQQLGAKVEELQVSDLCVIENAFQNIHFENYNYLLFTSKHSIKFMMNFMQEKQLDIRLLSNMKIAVIGTSTAKYLQQYHVYADIIPDEAHGEAFYECLEKVLDKDDKVLFPRVKQDTDIVERLRNICDLKDIALYENKKNIHFKLDENDIKQFHFIVFNCSSSVRYVMEQIKNHEVLKDSIIVSIGNTTSATLRSFGIHHFYQANEASYQSIRDKILELWEEKRCIVEED